LLYNANTLQNSSVILSLVQ